MFRLAGTTVLLGVVLAALAVTATAATVPPDPALYQAQVEDSTATAPLDAAVVSWAQGQPAGTASLPDAHERSAQPTSVLVIADAHERAQPRPVIVATDTGTDLGWTRIIFGAFVGGAFLIGLVWLTITVFGTHRGHPPLAHH
jgi:hypothetical protein